ncbi:hypothetical protein ANN_13640 [Periplaneta americana]|uniref:Uncharacterized protein n=1 Tax=Periplaneta americana TaxID=6978 RepID=A0ABQ8TJZ1_PERAM|nr:hypothetical protein ANN_13640 [Periplaneta americana]
MVLTVSGMSKDFKPVQLYRNLPYFIIFQILVLAALLLLATTTMAGVAPLALPYAVAPFGSSYTAHSINHALAALVAVPAAPVAVPAAALVAVPAAPVAVPAAAPVAVPAAPVAVPATPVAVPAAPVAVPVAAPLIAAAPAVYAPHVAAPAAYFG